MENGKPKTENRKLSNEQGYTLVEIILYSGILALFLLLTVQIFISVKLSSAHSDVFVSLSKNFRQTVSDLTPTIKGAETVTSPLPGETVSVLSLNDGLILYQLGDGVFRKTENGQTWDLTTEEVTVSNLSFQNLAEVDQAASIKIKMTLESNHLLEGGRRLSDYIETTVNLR
jgi:hypothetical protein